MTRQWHAGTAALCVGLAIGCSSNSSADGADSGRCAQPDQDGVIGGGFTFQVEISDTAFLPVILKAQNSGTVALTVKNTGSKPHDFVVKCLTVAGCIACFPDAATIAPLQPGASAMVTFTAPAQEGIYDFGSDVSGDAFAGQFILQ